MDPDTPVTITNEMICDCLAACSDADSYWKLRRRDAEGDIDLNLPTTYTVAQCDRFLEIFEELERQLNAAIDSAKDLA